MMDKGKTFADEMKERKDVYRAAYEISLDHVRTLLDAERRVIYG